MKAMVKCDWVVANIFNCDAIVTARFPPSNVLNCTQWDPLDPNDDFLRKIIGSFEALARKPFDVEYCVGYLGEEVGLTSLPQNLVGSSTPYVCEPQHVKVPFGFFLFF